MPRQLRPDHRHAHGRAAPDYALNVFINCPFDLSYRPIRDALVFAICQCGLRPRCALETTNSGQVRIEKIGGLIRDCRWGIHDLSRTELNENSLPRFNMPLEPGLFLGAWRCGNSEQRLKTCLVLDRSHTGSTSMSATSPARTSFRMVTIRRERSRRFGTGWRHPCHLKRAASPGHEQ